MSAKHNHSFPDSDYSFDCMAWKCRCGLYTADKKYVELMTREEALKKIEGFEMKGFIE